LRIVRVPAIGGGGAAAATSSFFAALLSSLGDYDVVHFHAEGPCAFIWIPKLLGKRCVATVHGLDWKRGKWARSVGSLYIRLGEIALAKWADEIIVLSLSAQRYFLEKYKRKTALVPNGAPAPEIREARVIRERLSLEKDGYILYLGRLTVEKGIHYLLRAYMKCGTDKLLVIAGSFEGSGKYGEELKKMALGNRKIVFAGFAQGELLAELYSNAYVYVLPSDIEGMPLSLLEAMSYGNCCLVSSIDEMAEVVEDRAAVFRKGDVGDLAEKLQALCDNPRLVASYRLHASEFVRGKYSWDSMAEKTLALCLGAGAVKGA
jgi:glycosyltransferase involved in cell wall biosynthesis